MVNFDPRNTEDVIQNLEDAGCSAEFIRKYLEISDRGGSIPVRLRLLEGQRKKLLGQLHAQQRRLDCFDYLRYQLQKDQKNQRKDQTK